MTMISNINDYFVKGCGRCNRFATPNCSVRKFESGLTELRRICLSMELEETVKWGQPCYAFAGRNIAIIGAFQDKFVLGLFNAALMKDPEGILIKSGPNSQHADRFQFTTIEQVKKFEKTICSYLSEAKEYAKAGIKAPKIAPEIDVPDELVEAMDADPELAEAFHALTPGRKRSYTINLNSAKNKSTRISRIAKFRDKIIAGKGALER